MPTAISSTEKYGGSPDRASGLPRVPIRSGASDMPTKRQRLAPRPVPSMEADLPLPCDTDTGLSALSRTLTRKEMPRRAFDQPCLVDLRGIEPLTSSMPRKRSACLWQASIVSSGVRGPGQGPLTLTARYVRHTTTLKGTPPACGLSPGDVHRHARSLLQNRTDHRGQHSFGPSCPTTRVGDACVPRGMGRNGRTRRGRPSRAS